MPAQPLTKFVAYFVAPQFVYFVLLLLLHRALDRMSCTRLRLYSCHVHNPRHSVRQRQDERIKLPPAPGLEPGGSMLGTCTRS